MSFGCFRRIFFKLFGRFLGIFEVFFYFFYFEGFLRFLDQGFWSMSLVFSNITVHLSNFSVCTFHTLNLGTTELMIL